MLIKNIETVNSFKEAKQKLYCITKLINVQFESVNPIYLFIVHTILVFPFISVLFITPRIFPSSVSSVFKIFLFTNLISTFGVDANVITTAILVFSFLIFILTVLHFVFTSIFAFCSKMLSLFIKLAEYFMVPLVNYAAFCYTQFNHLQQGRIQALYGITFFLINFAIMFVFLLVKFEIRMLRKRNNVWNLDNDLHLYALSFIALKTYFISFYGTTISICILSLGISYFLFQMDCGCINKIERNVERSSYYVLAATDFAALVSLATNNQVLGVYSWILSFGSIIAFISIDFYMKSKERIYIPPCDSPPQDFYNFYYEFKEEFKSEQINAGNKKNYKNMINLHRIHCRNQCRINTKNFQENDEAILEEITQLITYRKNQNIKNRLVYELWNLELGQKCDVECLIDKPLTLKEDFILYSIDKFTKDSEATMKSTESNKNIISKVFYDLIYEISSHYSLFYEELGRAHPKIDSMVELGISIRKKVEKLKQIYAQLLKTRLINFKMIELYLQFFANFVNQNVMDKESISRLMKVQQHMHFEDIAENYLPTFTFYPDTGNLENANSEAQKLLQCTRFELKYRNISDILLPTVGIEQAKRIASKSQSQLEDEPIYTFLKKSQGEYAFGKISMHERYIKQKKVIILQVIKEPYSSLKNMFLLSSDFTIQLMLHTTSKIKIAHFYKNPIVLDWLQLFGNHIMGEKEKLIKSKMAKVQLEYKGCLMIIKKVNSYDQNNHLIFAQIIVSNESKDRKESILQNRRSFQIRKEESKFQFHYGEDQTNSNKLLILGYKEPNTYKLCSNYNTFDMLQKQMMLASSAFQPDRYAKDIKTYRLFGGDLYNIDLEDKQAYNDLFEEHANESKKKQVNEQSVVECYIFVGVILLGLCLISFSVVLIITFQSGSANISSSYFKYQNIEQFKIDFQRIVAVLRDEYSGLNHKYPSFRLNDQISQSYNRIQVLKKNKIFDNTQYTMQFQDFTMVGTLSQLVDVILAHVTEFTYTNDTGIILQIIEATVYQLNGMITSNQNEILESIGKSIGDISFLKNVMLYCSIGVMVLLYFFMVSYCVKSNYKSKDKLTELMYMSDTEARTLQENAQKMKYAVEMARKNFDVDTENLLLTVNDTKKRKNPKEPILSREVIYSIGTITAIGIIIHLTCLFFFSSQFSTQITNFSTMKAQGIAVQSLYSESAQLATEIFQTQKINYAKLKNIRNQLNTLQHQVGQLLFSSTLNKFIDTFFFQNSCSQLKAYYNYSAAECAKTCPGFTVSNPFEVGVALYLNRQNYYVSNNITENYAHTGVFSRQFARVFTNLTQQIQQQGTNSLGNTLNIVVLLNGLIILIDCAYILAFFVIYNYFKEQLVQIKEILYFFNSKWKGKRYKESADEDEEDKGSDSEQESLGQMSKSRKRKTTIDQDVSHQF